MFAGVHASDGAGKAQSGARVLVSMLLPEEATRMRVRFVPLLPVAALVAVAGIAAAVWASAPAPSDAVDWRRIEQLCLANGGYYYRTEGGGACIDTSDMQ